MTIFYSFYHKLSSTDKGVYLDIFDPKYIFLSFLLDSKKKNTTFRFLTDLHISWSWDTEKMKLDMPSVRRWRPHKIHER